MGTKRRLLPGWSTEPAPAESQYNCPLIRVRKDKPVTVVFLDPTPVGKYVHWNGNRTIPCTEERCELCPKNYRKDYKLYSGVWSPGTGAVGVIELPYSALKFFQQQFVRCLTSYGYRAECSRVGNGEKGKVVVLFKGKYDGPTPLPEGPNPMLYMEKVWGVHPSDPTPSNQRGTKTHPGGNGRCPLPGVSCPE